MDAMGALFFLEAATGKLLSSYDTGASDACGPSVVDGVVYTGSGYLNLCVRRRARLVQRLPVVRDQACCRGRGTAGASGTSS